eukprot:15445296-Alexandrium_andersonii.AAC.1
MSLEPVQSPRGSGHRWDHCNGRQCKMRSVSACVVLVGHSAWVRASSRVQTHVRAQWLGVQRVLQCARPPILYISSVCVRRVCE